MAKWCTPRPIRTWEQRSPTEVLSGHVGKLPPAPVARRPRAGHRCNRLAFCLFAIGGTALYGESGFPACGRTRLPPPARGAPVPTISPCLDSNGFVHRACAEGL